MRRLTHLRRDEKGMTMVFVGMGFMAFLAASMLAIDVGMLMTGRSQAQNSADAGALGGATALVFDDWDNRSATGPAVMNALTAARGNQVMSASVNVGPADVEFPNDANGINDRVRVTVYRTAQRGNPVSTLIARYFGVATADLVAAATAEASPANAETCVKPFTIPDRWIENQTPGFDATDTYEYYDKKGAVLANHDTYIPANQPGYTGYTVQRDRGMMLMIRAGTGNNIEPDMYFSWKMPNAIGADFYRDNISNCNTSIVTWNQPMTQEPGDMMGPTVDGVKDLIAKDPNAYWDEDTNSVHSAMHPSPRVFPIPLYDPQFYADGKKNGRDASLRVANWIGFFLDHVDGNNIYGRITPILGVIDKNSGPAPAGVLPVAIRLVQ